MKKAKNPRKALLIISDGGDNNSRYTETEVKNLVKEADVQIYAIGIYEMGATRGRTPEEANGPGLLTEITEQTGGRQYEVDNINELPDVAAKDRSGTCGISIFSAIRRRTRNATESTGGCK